MDENLTLDDPSALDAPVEDTQPSLVLNVPEASPTVYPVQQASNPLDKVSADIAAKRSALAALPPVQQRVIDLSRIWTAPTETPKPQDFASYAGEKYSVLDTAAKQSVWDGYVRSELPKSLPAGYTPEQLAAAKARFEASNPRPQDTGFYSYLKSGVASTMNAVSSAVSTKTPESLARSTIASIKDQIDDPEIAVLQKNIAQQVKDAGGSTLWNELKVRTAEYATNPRLFAKMAVQQLPNSIPALAGAIAGGKAGAVAGGTAGTFVIPGIGTVGGGVVGGAVGAVVGGFLGGVAPEYGSDLVQRIQTEAQAAGVDVRNQTALEAFIKERGVDHFTDPALRKGVGTAATDSVFNALVVGRLGSVASTQAKVILKTEADLAKGIITADQAAVSLAKAQGRIAAAQAPLTRVMHAAGTSGIEALGEGVSEAAGRFYADNKIDWGDVADETLFGLAHGTAFEAGGKVWSAATGAASEYDQAVAKLNARLVPPVTPSTTATATTPTATDTPSTPEAPAVESAATDMTPVLPTIDDAAIARLKEIVPDFNETANITENGALSLDPDQTAALQQVIENLPAADQQFLYDLALGVNANETTSTETNPAANQQTAVSAQETIPGSTVPTSSDTVGVSGLPTDGSGASTGAVLDGRSASENRTDTGPATSEVVGGPVVDNVNTTSTKGPGSPGTDGTGTSPSVESLVDNLVTYDTGTEPIIGALRRSPQGLFVQDAQGNRTLVESGESGATAESLGLRPYHQSKRVRQSLLRSENRTRPDEFVPQITAQRVPISISPEIQVAVSAQNKGIQNSLNENNETYVPESELAAWVDLLSTQYDDTELAFIAYEIQRGLALAGKTGTDKQVIAQIQKVIDENYRPFASTRSSQTTTEVATIPTTSGAGANSQTTSATKTETQGVTNATDQINQQESVQQQRGPGDQTRQAAEAGSSNRVQRSEQSTATQEKVTTQNVTEKTLESLRLRAEEVLSRLSTEETISVRDYFEQVQPPDDGGKVSIRTEMRKLLGDLEARVEQGDAALRAGKQALTSDEVRALHDEVAGGIVYATTEELAKNIPVDALVERALRNNDARGALTVMSRTASTPLARAVASRLLSQVSTSTKVAVAPVDNVDTAKLNGRKASGSYHPGTNTLTLDPEANGLTERTVLHEVTHAATIEAIRNPDTAVKRAAVKELQRIMAYAKKSLPGVRHYGFTNLEEFVAEAFSNPVFQRDLYNIKTGPKVSLWSRVVNAVLKSTGLDKIIGLVNDDNLLGKTLTAADLLMQPASAKASENTKAVAANQGEPTTAPLWRSALTEATNKAPFEKNAASQWKTWLQSNAAKLGVKKDEIEWSGITDWLDLQQGKVSREQVQQYLAQNGVKVTETELGGKAGGLENLLTANDIRVEPEGDAGRWFIESPTNSVTARAETEDQAIAFGVRYFNSQINERNRERERAADNTKYSSYTLPGGENYRELLLTLPEKKNAPVDAGKSAATMLFENDMMDKYGGQSFPSIYNKLSPSEIDKYEMYVREDRNAAKSESLAQDRRNNYKSSHWDQPNILAHIRFNERTDADGKRVLFIEEIQSDWGQEGKKKGFAQAVPFEVQERSPDYFVIVNKADGKRVEMPGGLVAFTSREAAQHAIDDGAARNGYGVDNGVPNAPFVGKTEAWVSLALKRMIRYAVDNGFDRVAMVTGEQSAERYDLSKQVDYIDYIKSAPDRWNVAVVPKVGDDIQRNALTAEQLEELVGKEVAQKIVNGEGQSGGGRKTLRGLDLKVGGEGMKAFYDKIVPQVANDVLKKLGGGKVGTVDVSVGIAPKNKPRGDIARTVLGNDSVADQVQPQPGFDITPAMREHAEQGMLLFAPTDLAAQTETDLAALQGGRKPTIGIQNESVGTKLRTLKVAAREALIDYQVPIYNWLESIYGVGKAATNATWQTLKTIGPKRDELNHQFKTGTLHDINTVGKELATKYGLKIEEAVSTLGEYAKYVHVPEANATLLARLQKAANDANADLRNATTDLALAQQEYDQAKLDVKSKKAPVANAKTFSRADAELKQATKAYNDAVKIRDAADAALQAGPDRQAGHLTDAQAQDSKAYLESKYDVALLQKGQQLLVKANRDALDASVRAGVVDAKTAASLKATYPNYVPLFVDKDSLGTDPWSAMDGAPDLFSQSINATLIKERKGYLENSDVRSDNAYINTIAKVAATNSRVAAQPFKNQLLVMALNKDAGKELSVKPLRGNNPDPRGMVAKDSKGQQYQVMFKSDQLADAVYSRGVEEFGTQGLPGLIASIGRVIARSVTQYTLAFAPVNLVRDVGEKTLLVRSRKFLDANGKPVDGRALAGTMTKLLATDFLSIITSINQAVRDKPPAVPGKYYAVIKEMMSEGGLSTWGDIFQKSRIEVLNEVKKLQGWRRLPAAFNDVVHKYNHTFDMMSSTLAYTAMKQAGMTPRAAAFATMDLMNFRNKGKKTGWIRALYLFANPALQSGANFIDHVKTKQGKIDAVVLGVLALAIYQLALMTGDDDELLGNEIDQRNTTEIERSMVFMVDGVPVKVPVPYGMAQIMWAFAVNGTRFARGVTSGADALADSIKSTFKSISPISPSEIEATKNPLMFMVQTLTPSTLRPIVDVATNTSAFGAPITKPRLNPKIPASAQGRENTEGFWKDTAKKLYETTGADVAPEKIKALWLGFTAGPIADATKAITFDKDEKGLTTSFRDDLRYLMPLGFNRLVGGDSTFLQAKYYDSLKQAENLVKKYGLAEIDSNRTLNTGGKAVARKAILDKAPGITDNDKKLVAAYYAERAIVTKEGQSKKKDLSRAKTPESIADINSKYEDTSEARMRDFLSRLK